MNKKVEEAGKRPRSRTEGLVVRQAGEELLVYDLERHRAHCLNRAAAIVWDSVMVCVRSKRLPSASGKRRMRL